MKKNEERILVITVAALLVVCFFPFLYATRFVYPLSIHEWDWLGHFWGQTTGLDYWQTQLYWYRRTGGRYTSTALLSTLPYWYDLNVFRWVTLLLVALLPLSSIYALMRLTRPVPGFLLGSICWMLFLDQLTNPYDSLLRFTCLPIYHFGFALTFLIGMGWWRAVQRAFPLSWETAALTLLSILAVGTNELTLIHVGLLLLFSGIYAYRTYGRIPVSWLVIALGTCIGMAAALLAPGNYARMELYPVERAPFETLLLSLGVSIFLVVDWLTNSLLVPVGICIPLAYYRYFQNQSFPCFTQPWYWWAAAIVLVPVSLFPLLYGTGGTSLPERVIDLLFWIFSILLIGAVLSLQQRRHAADKQLELPQPWTARVGGVLIIFTIFNLLLGGLTIERDPALRQNGRLSLIRIEANIGKAYLQIVRGIPRRYAEEMEAMENLAVACSDRVCTVPALTVPEFIGYDSLYDRRWSGGESGQNAYWGLPPKTIVRYEQ